MRTEARLVIQVLTGLEPFPGAKHSIVGNVVGGARPHRPPGPSEWLSDNVWDLVCGCWPALRASRPDAGLVMNALNNAGNIIEFKRSEPDLIALLDVSKTGANGNPEVKRAQELVDLVDLVRQPEGATTPDNLTTHTDARKRGPRQAKPEAIFKALAETVRYLCHSPIFVHARANTRQMRSCAIRLRRFLRRVQGNL